MSFLAQNWDLIMTLINSIGLAFLAGKKANK